MSHATTTQDPPAAPSNDYTMNKKLGAIAMLISATGMGLVGFLSRGATVGLPQEAKSTIGSFLAFGRMTTGFVGFILILLITRNITKLRHTKLSPAVILGGICIGLSLGFYISSTLMTSIANAVFLIYTGPLFCTLFARIFRKEKISALAGLFLFLVFVGMILTMGVIDWTPEAGWKFGLDLSASTAKFPQKGLGDTFGLLSGLLYGLAMFFYGYRKDMDSTVRGAWNFLWAALATAAMSLVMQPKVGRLSPTNWGWATVLFLVCGFVAIGFLVVAGRNLPAVEYSTISYWECAVAIFFGFFVFGESMTMLGAVGGLLIIGGGLAPILIDARRRKAGGPGDRETPGANATEG